MLYEVLKKFVNLSAIYGDKKAVENIFDDDPSLATLMNLTMVLHDLGRSPHVAHPPAGGEVFAFLDEEGAKLLKAGLSAEDHVLGVLIPEFPIQK